MSTFPSLTEARQEYDKLHVQQVEEYRQRLISGLVQFLKSHPNGGVYYSTMLHVMGGLTDKCVDEVRKQLEADGWYVSTNVSNTITLDGLDTYHSVAFDIRTTPLIEPPKLSWLDKVKGWFGKNT